MVVVGDSWDLDLRLSLGRSTDLSPAESVSSSRTSGMDRSFGDSTHCSQQQQQRQLPRKKVTMFYNGWICACDVTEMQANAILSMATGGMDDTTSENKQHQDTYQQPRQRMAQSSPFPSALPSPQALQQIHQPGLSMKRSLQRFLQKRKSRIGAASPYAHRKQHLSLFPINS